MMESMMATVQTLTRRFERVFEPEQAVVLAETITEAYSATAPHLATVVAFPHTGLATHPAGLHPQPAHLSTQ